MKTDDLIELYFENCLVCADFHVPGQSDYWINKLLDYARQNKITKLIIAGDFWNLDALSRFVLKEKNMILSREVSVGKKVLFKLLDHLEVWMLCGNHDLRLMNALNGAIDFKDAMSLVNDQVIVTNYDHLYLISGNHKFRICHPPMYSKIKGRIVSNLSQSLQENILMGHQHFFSIMTNINDKYICVDLPCMCDPQAFEYKNRATSAFPEWNNGFIHVQRGKIKLVSRYLF